MTYPDEGFRLLTLYKYWNMIQYYFPYKHLTEKDWNTTLKEYIPDFINAKNEFEFEVATIKLIGEVKDTHANLWSGNNAVQEERGTYYQPVHVRFIENKLIVTDYYNPEMQSQVGLNIGDVITKINGVSVEELVKEKLPVYPASNYTTQLRDISRDLLRSNSKTLELSYVREQEEVSINIPLFETKEMNYYGWYREEPDGKSFKIMDGNIGYINLKNIKEDDIDVIKEELKDTKGIIVDIRNYPSTFVVFSLGSFFTSNKTDFVKFTKGNPDYPGEFTFTEPLQIGIDKSSSYNGKNIVVLVNELSQSQAEYTAMAFRAGDKTTIVGSTTAGADGNVSSFILPGGMRTMISGIGVYYPDGTETQGVGIVPDVEVLPTIQGIKDGRDEPLEKAIEIINKL
jgi:C-terminal processing protease CtpA/Prc